LRGWSGKELSLTAQFVGGMSDEEGGEVGDFIFFI